MIKNEKGFTIVELIIVIVVIAILAAVTMVTYTGIRKNAETVAYTSTVDDLEKHLRIADTKRLLPRDEATLGGTLSDLVHVLVFTVGSAAGIPLPGGVCVGDISRFPAADGFEAGECYRIEGSADGIAESNSMSIDEELSNRLKAAGMKLPGALPVVKRTITNNGTTATIMARGVYMLMSETYIYLLWNPADASNCGRGVNVEKQLKSQIYEHAGSIDELIAEIKADPAQLNEQLEENGADWEQKLREAYALINSPDRPGSCVLSFTR